MTMKFSHYKRFFEDRFRLEIDDSVPHSSHAEEKIIKQGTLVEKRTGKAYKIVNSIPRFLDADTNYSDNFGETFSL